jgi:hypothetical protein
VILPPLSGHPLKKSTANVYIIKVYPKTMGRKAQEIAALSKVNGVNCNFCIWLSLTLFLPRKLGFEN